MKGVCKNNLLVLFLVILLTIIVVYISINTFNREMFTSISLNNRDNEGNLLFYTQLLNDELQQKVENIIEKGKNIDLIDNNVLSNRHYQQVVETTRPELIPENDKSPKSMCYIDLQNM
tara:strand:+ start:233 stop:586 length:354 start_codon:yes stop_codon:yes gene_type:complete